MRKIKVEVHANAPLFVEADADHFGELFSHMGSDEQVQVLAAMVKHMKPHSIQWDHISIELEKPENAETRNQLRTLFPL